MKCEPASKLSLVSGNYHEPAEPVVMVMASIDVKIRHVFADTPLTEESIGAVNSIFLISGTITFSHSIGKKNEASVPIFYADWTSVPVPRTSSLRGLDVGFIPLLPKGLPYMANNDEYTDEYNDEYNDEYLRRDFFVGFNF